jgi:DNA-binding beta-propeller fold protein YncE
MTVNFYFKAFLKNAAWLISFFIIFCNGCSSSKISKEREAILPGMYENYTLLPNGWRLTPIGKSVTIGEFPLNMKITKDEKYAITSNSGTAEHSLSLIDLELNKEIQRIILDKTWRGLAFNFDESILYASGGNNNLIYLLSFINGKLSLIDSIMIGIPYPKENISITGIAILNKKNILLAVTKEDNSLYVIDLFSKNIVKRIDLGEKCFDVIADEKEEYAYISLWGGAAVAVINLNDFTIEETIKVGDHPCELLLSNKSRRLFVTNANNNSVSVVDLNKHKESERIISSLTYDAPYGSTPNAIAFGIDESLLFIANADNNYLALFNIEEINNSRIEGFIPTSWYPTSVKYLKHTDELVVANAKGLGSQANPDGAVPTDKDRYIGRQYIGTLFKGSIIKFSCPSNEEMNELSYLVYQNTPYISKPEEFVSDQSVVPIEHSGVRSDKLKYIFYIIKENRTYDQMLGDLPQGNGDSSLCIFPRKVTPNHHALAEEFVLFDNFYVDAEVSADGHNWSTAAYATDYVEKNWPTLYGRRGGTYDFEGGVPIAAPSSGYIWDNVMKNGISFRNYGEYVERYPDRSDRYRARDEYLRPFTCEEFPGYDLSISDIFRFEKWSEDFDNLLQKDSIPNFHIIRLPNDHTAGTRAGYITPTAYVAQNDYALGLMVDKISKSKIWKESVIFVLEDDAQNGSDHVDAHRSILFVISPYVRRNFVDHTMYSTSSVLKTIELIFGLPPMTQFDLSANPILEPFNDLPDFSGYDVIAPDIDLNEKNQADAYGSQRSTEMNLTREDAIPDIEFNEIIWKAIRGIDSEMPPPVRSAFVKIYSKDDD